jgi:hypothetical protein
MSTLCLVRSFVKCDKVPRTARGDTHTFLGYPGIPPGPNRPQASVRGVRLEQVLVLRRLTELIVGH